MKTSLIVKITALVCGVIVLATGLIVLRGEKQLAADGDFHVVASFYPIYVAALQLTDGIEGVTVESLTPATTGCLHDYQLSPTDLVTLRRADALLLNGAGAESFLDPVRERYPSLPLIDSSEGVPLLEASHEHTHEEDHDSEEEEGAHAYNSHLWTSPVRYRAQVENLCEGLCALDPAHADAYRANAARYTAEIEAVSSRLYAAADVLPSDVGVVLFHDSLVYWADDLGLDVLAILPVGEEEGVGASELSAAADAIRRTERTLFIYDDQYRDLQYDYLQAEAANAATLFLDTAVSGEAVKEAWLEAMTAAAVALEGVTL